MPRLPQINSVASKTSRLFESEDMMFSYSGPCTPLESESRSRSSNDINRASSPSLPTISNCHSVSSEHTDGSVTSQDSLDSPFFMRSPLKGSQVAADGSKQFNRSQRLLASSPGSQQLDRGAEVLKSSKNPQFSSSSKRLSPTLSPLVISPYQPCSRNPSMSPSSVPLSNLKCLETFFPDSRPYSPGEMNEVSSLNLRKKALTPMNLLRGMRQTPSPHNRSSSKQSALLPMSTNTSSSPSSFFTTTPHHSYHSNSVYSSWCATSRSVDSAMTDEEVEETVKHAIAVALKEKDEESLEEDESEDRHR